MKYQILADASEKTANAIFISGGTRTGTSLMAQLIYSLERVECFHEPAFLYAFFYMMDELGAEQWKILLESFVYEELLLAALAGRRMNLNEHDQSSAHRSVSREEIAQRLSRTHRHHELVPRAREYRVAFKMPETIPQLERLRCYYPKMTFLVMLRRPENTIASLIERGWYSDQQMKTVGGEWFFRRRAHTKIKIPPWVPDELVDEFVRAPEVDRCAMCYIQQYKYLLDRRDCVVVDFDQLIKKPQRYFSAVAEALGERFGPLTSTLIGSIHEPPKDRAIPSADIAPARRTAMAEIYDRCRALALAVHGEQAHMPA